MGTEFFRYVVAGVCAFICDFGMLVFATEVLGVHYLISNIAGYALGLIVSYTLNVKWVFNHRRFGDRHWFEFIYFTVIVFVGLAISEGVLWLVTESAETHYAVAKIVSTFFVFLFNFVAKKFLLFTPAKDESATSTQTH